MQTYMEQASARVIGYVESVSPLEIKVLLDIEAPQSTALNAGTPMAFPRINSFVIVPNERGAIVGLVTWLGVERSAYPKRTGMQDFGLIDLPFPLRKMSLSPLGTLTTTNDEEGNAQYCLERGVYVFPSVGDSVLIPTPAQLRSVIEASTKEDGRVPIGTSPLTNQAIISIDPDKLFGRHLAILGNTGSGKSCSVAGLIRWTLEKANETRLKSQKKSPPKGARFIILDPNGEYSDSFSSLNDLGFKVKVFGFSKDTPKEHVSLPLPAWLWNAEEWAAFTRAAPGVQNPLLLQALRKVKSIISNTEQETLWNDIKECSFQIESILANKTFLQPQPGTKKEVYSSVLNVQQTAKSLGLIEVTDNAEIIIRTANTNRDGWVNGTFKRSELEDLLQSINEALPAASVGNTSIECEDSPIMFSPASLPREIEMLATSIDSKTRQQVGTLVMRIESLLKDERLRPIISPSVGPKSFKEWIDLLFGLPGEDQHDVIILNLQFLPYDILHMTIAVLARIIFTMTQHHRRITNTELATVLILEEAHTFVKKGSEVTEGPPDPAQMCRRTFERIAREGRKFGLGLVLASQRPSELSPTVLSQCNTFLLHRIVNDRDQELVGKLVPDNLGGLLRELPTLPSRQAILLGWATPVPVLVEMNKLPDRYRPQSPDPSFWKSWTEDPFQLMNHDTIANAMTHTAECPLPEEIVSDASGEPIDEW